jgi:prepilin-type N-terminal cleavage/methylation domain-containing protein
LQPAEDTRPPLSRDLTRGPSRRRGVTLVELLVVITVIGVLLSIGVGVWLAFRAGSTRARAFRNLVGAVRRARVFAIEESAASRLVLTRPRNAPHGFHAEGLRLVGFWNLEQPKDPTKDEVSDPLTGFAGRKLEQFDGVFNIDGKMDLPVEGYRGTGIFFENGGRIVLPGESTRLPRGGTVSFWLLPAYENAKQNLLTRGRELEFVFTQQGKLEATVGSAIIDTGGYRLVPGRWSHIELRFSPREVVICVNGVERARTKPGEDFEMPDPKELDLPMEMGAGEWKIYGRLDEIAVRRAVREEPFQLPPEFVIECQVDELRFDSSGRLDRRFHNGPVKVAITSPETGSEVKTRSMTIDLMGNIKE